MAGIDQKVAIITGAGRGMGKGIALAYGRAGAKVVVASRTASTVEEVVKQINGEGGIAAGITCDVGNKQEVFGMVDFAVQTFGTVDILVNNAQAFCSPKSNRRSAGDGQPLETYDEDDWNAVHVTGLMATLWGMQAVFPYMKNRGGKIINVGSTAAQFGLAGFGAYAATKEGIRGLSRVAAREWGKYGINVNVFNPAVYSDAMIEREQLNPELMEQMLAQVPLRRWGDPVKDAGGLAIFLASPESDYITGMTILLDGGQHMFP